MNTDLHINRSTALDSAAEYFTRSQWELDDAELFGRPFERQTFALTATLNDRIVGTATGWLGMKVAYLSGLIVDRELRNRGIGAHLLAAFEILARDEGFTRLALRTPRDRPAQRFYQRHGWQVEAEIEDWVGGLPFVQMRKDL